LEDTLAEPRVLSPWAESRAFLAVLALLTLIPLIGLPALLLGRPAGSPPLPGLLTILFVTGSVHVASTAYFYFDRSFWPVLREAPLRCFWSIGLVPLILVVLGVAGMWAIGTWTLVLIIGGHNAWLFYHYQRQNFGLIAFVGRHVGFGPLPPTLGTALDLMALGAIVSMFGISGFLPDKDGLISDHAHALFRTAGVVVFVVASALMAWVLLRERRIMRYPSLTGAVLLGWSFFLPAIVFDAKGVTFLPYAIAHGAQYLLMMAILSGRSAGTWRALAGMCALAGGIGWTIEASNALWPWILAGTGLVQVHFLVDAKVWRLREPRQRAIMSDRFDFLLRS
jgi:hypothetical protein